MSKELVEKDERERGWSEALVEHASEVGTHDRPARLPAKVLTIWVYSESWTSLGPLEQLGP